MRSDFETIVVSRHEDQILLVTLNRPEVSNALNTRMGLDLTELFETLAIDLAGLRIVIITGSGDKTFCAGGDLKERNGMTDESWQSQHAIFERMLRAMLGCPLPLLAAVNGAAYGGGCEIAAASDFVYAATHARFALTEVTLGIMPGMGGMQMSLWDGLAFEIEAYNRLVPTEDRREGVLAFNERRKPIFRGV